ncbi:MAG TPA: DUF86 domain-containing protein [Clostridia bacterium]|nr:DUF86 domain-containing protein [Clostridia bacterium]
MVDKEKIRSKIQFIQANILKLQQLKERPQEEFLRDFRNVEAAKHLLQVSIEAMLDIANHIIARNRWTTPATSADSFKILAEKGFFSPEELETFLKMIRFRNRIVPIYQAIDDKEIYHILQRSLDDFRVFMKRIILQLF